MNKNYYDILQVNKNASPEIIEKAYKTLAKKYHPDLQTEENKKQAEEILKEINEAYEVLSNPEKKQMYDTSLSQQETKNNSSTYYKQSRTNDSAPTTKISKEELLFRQQQELLHQQEMAYQQQLQRIREKAYYDAYIQDLKKRGYKIRYKKNLKDYIRGFISIITVILILVILWQIPFVQNFFISLYEKNKIIHLVVNFISNLFH